MTFPATVCVVDIRKHKSRGDTIVRHSGPFFIAQPGVSREIRRRMLAQTGPSKYFNYSSGLHRLADEITRALIDDTHTMFQIPFSPHEQSNPPRRFPRESSSKLVASGQTETYRLIGLWISEERKVSARDAPSINGRFDESRNPWRCISSSVSVWNLSDCSRPLHEEGINWRQINLGDRSISSSSMDRRNLRRLPLWVSQFVDLSIPS